MSYAVYHSVQSKKDDGYEEVKAFAQNEGLVSSVDRVHYYNGNRAFHIIEGETNESEPVYVWVEQIESEDENDGAEPVVVTRAQEAGISKSEARQIAEERLDIDELKQIRLGMIGQTPVFEIVYIDTDERYSFYYINFEDGSYIRHYQLRQNG